MIKPKRPNRPPVEEAEPEPPRRFHSLDGLLAAATRAQAAASEQGLHQVLAAGWCVRGYRKHRMDKNAPGPIPGKVCSRCGYVREFKTDDPPEQKENL